MVILPNGTRYDHRVKSNEALDVDKKPKRGEWFFVEEEVEEEDEVIVLLVLLHLLNET